MKISVGPKNPSESSKGERGSSYSMYNASVVALRVRKIKSDEKKNEMIINATCASDDCSSRVLNVHVFYNDCEGQYYIHLTDSVVEWFGDTKMAVYGT